VKRAARQISIEPTQFTRVNADMTGDAAAAGGFFCLQISLTCNKETTRLRDDDIMEAKMAACSCCRYRKTGRLSSVVVGSKVSAT